MVKLGGDTVKADISRIYFEVSFVRFSNGETSVGFSRNYLRVELNIVDCRTRQSNRGKENDSFHNFPITGKFQTTNIFVIQPNPQ